MKLVCEVCKKSLPNKKKFYSTEGGVMHAHCFKKYALDALGVVSYAMDEYLKEESQ